MFMELSIAAVAASITAAVCMSFIFAAVRRLHDTGRSGWRLLLLLVPAIGGLLVLFWLMQESEPRRNAFGSVPMNGSWRESGVAPTKKASDTASTDKGPSWGKDEEDSMAQPERDGVSDQAERLVRELAEERAKTQRLEEAQRMLEAAHSQEIERLEKEHGTKDCENPLRSQPAPQPFGAPGGGVPGQWGHAVD